MTIDSTRRPEARRWRMWAVAFVVATALVACATAPTPPEQEEPIPLGIESVAATSQTSIAVVFDDVPGLEAAEAANYQVLGPDGGPLDVVAVHLRADATRVVLVTAPQLVVPYALTVVGVGRADGAVAAAEIQAPGTFVGSDVPAPVLASAIALDPQRVLLTFEDPVTGALAELEDAALEAARYAVTGGDATVLGASFAASGDDRGRVIVATSVQEDLAYQVQANVVAASGVPVDPFRASAAFTGIPATDVAPPTVVAVRAPDDASVRIAFSEPLGANAGEADRYTLRDADGAVVPVSSATLNDVATEVLLSTWPMVRGALHEVEVAGVVDRSGNAILASTTPFRVPTGEAPVDDQPPRVVSAISTSPTTIVVSFDEQVRGGTTSAENPAHYSIVDVASVSGIGTQAVVLVQAARLSASGRSVTLTTLAQSGIEYALRVANVVDLAGNQVVGPDRDRPYHVVFRGTAGSGPGLDSDGDGLTDAEEQAGWTVSMRLADGRTESRVVTSDPFMADSDGDGVSDFVERTFGTDPRRVDTDGDQISDDLELNYVYSDPTDQDSDGDGLADGLEWYSFRTSPLLEDTDGDQIADGLEVTLGNRNPRLADLPLPAIEVGAVDLQLDVRFVATSQTGSRELETRNVSTTLQQSDTQSFSRSDSNTQSFSVKAAVEASWKVGADFGYRGKFSVEAGYSGSWTSSFDRGSVQSSQEEYARSFETAVELEFDESLSREVQGASMRLAVNLSSMGSIAFTISNLQVTAFVQDARRPGELVPIATLVPEGEPKSGYNLGPMVPVRGPLVFLADQVFPALVEQLMRDPTGLVFKISNYDLEDEFGRNFAYTSQEINDRTATVVIDYGGVSSSGDGRGVDTERLKVATSAGRPTFDLNQDGVIDDDDRILFDADGRQVGITLAEALQSIVGLVHYDEDEDETSTANLSVIQREASYSTRVIDGVETLWRMRGVAQDSNPLRSWVVLTTDGILAADQSIIERILHTEQGITLAFVQDLDDDGLPASYEYVLGCSDTAVDNDGDGLTDAEEVYLGWTVQVVDRRAYQGYSSCAREDSDLDGLTDDEERSLGTDAKLRDTDGDGISDFDEFNGFCIELRFDPPGAAPTCVTTDPLDPDTDGDSIPDGAERDLGLDPTVDDGDRVFDDDGDGLVNFLETEGWSVTTYAVSTVLGTQGADTTRQVTSDPRNPDTDGDSLSDARERELGTDPRNPDTDGDGLPDAEELALGTDPLDADTDNDGRSDGDEVDVGIVVRVAGAPRTVFSDPLVADADGDDLPDSLEALLGTDPTLSGFDTDDDGSSDGVEYLRSQDGNPNNITDPLARDQVVRVVYDLQGVRTNFNNICGEAELGSAHVAGTLDYTVNGANFSTNYNSNGKNVGTDWVVAVTQEHVLTALEGRGVTASGRNLRRLDGTTPYSLANFDSSYMPTAGGLFDSVRTETFRQTQTNFGSPEDCVINFRITITPLSLP